MLIHQLPHQEDPRHVPRTYRDARMDAATDARLQRLEEGMSIPQKGMSQLQRQMAWVVGFMSSQQRAEVYTPLVPRFDHEASMSGVRRPRDKDDAENKPATHR